MRNVKIRFVETFLSDNNGTRCSENSYYIQRKNLFGWCYFKYIVSCETGINSFKYENTNKDMLLQTIIDREYKTTKSHLKITEYPTIRIY